MKNQYFGDIRDLFKYDLIKFILENDKTLNGCVWIPMLTQNDDSGEGEIRHKPRAGFHNDELQIFLANYHESKSKRDIRHLRRVVFYRKNLNIYPDEEFTHDARSNYFKKISSLRLKGSLIFVDPDTGTDIGIQGTTVMRKPSSYIFSHEISDIYNRMGANATLMIYQHHRMETKELFAEKISIGLSQSKKVKPLYISDSQVAFFFLVKTASNRKKLGKMLEKYQVEYPELWMAK